MAFALRPKSIVFDDVWSDLRPSIIDIINLQPVTKLTWNHKFSDVYDICVAMPEPLSERLYNSVKACIEDHVKKLHEQISECDGEPLLAEYHRMWQVYYEGTKYVHRLFGYLNKQYVKHKEVIDADLYARFAPFLQKQGVKEIGSLAFDIWKEQLVQPSQDKLIHLLLTAIAEDREGRPPSNKSTINGVIQSFVLMEDHDFSMVEGNARDATASDRREGRHEFYENEFEKKFLEFTEQHYTALAQKLLADMTCSQYMEAVIQALEQEERRSVSYLYKSSVPKVIKLCQNVMINAHKEKLHAVCHDLITNEVRKDLSNMYRLLKHIDSGLQVIVKEFELYVKKTGLEAVQSLSGDNLPQQFVENVLQVYEKFIAMKTEVFMDDGDFAGALDKALQSVVNVREQGALPKASERLARYTDNLLRKSSKGLSDQEIDARLSKAIVIFRYIEDKDIFQKYYAKMLTNRLISGTSVSMDAEEMMINKLKQACGYEFTSKLSRMFMDIGLSNELSEKFHKNVTENNLNNVTVSMQPMILQAGSWPLMAPSKEGTSAQSQDQLNFILPSELQPCVMEFEKFYVAAHNGRKLTWVYNHSHGELKLNHLDKPYVVSMSVHQMAIMLAYESSDSFLISEISTATGLQGELLLKTVKTLVDAGLLSASENTLTTTSKVRLNLSFTSKRLRFRVPAPQLNKQTEKETESVNTTVTQDRRYYMECAIVRIMKTRKVLKHNSLIAEVVEQTKGRFTPDVQFIKKTIEDLIEKLYIQRTDQNDEYQYLA